MIRYIIIYVYTIAITSFHGDDGITPDGLRRRLQLCLFIFYRIFRYFSTLFVICNRNVTRDVEGTVPYNQPVQPNGCDLFILTDKNPKIFVGEEQPREKAQISRTGKSKRKARVATR